MARVGRGEDLDELWNHGAGEGAAGDDGGEFPPDRPVAHAGDQQGRQDVGHDDGDDRGQPHQRGQGNLEVELGAGAVLGLGPGSIDVVRQGARDDHADTHHEDPDQELDLDGRVLHRQQDEGDQGHARDAVGLEAVGGGADRVAGIVARAVGDDAGIAGVVFLDLEDDLHQVGADVGNLGEDAAGDSERRGPQRLTNGEADEAGPGRLARDEEQDEEHQHQLDADQQHADAHAGLQRDLHGREGLPAQARERRARVGQRVDSDPEPGHAVAPQDADDAEEDDQHDPVDREVQQ